MMSYMFCENHASIFYFHNTQAIIPLYRTTWPGCISIQPDLRPTPALWPIHGILRLESPRGLLSPRPRSKGGKQLDVFGHQIPLARGKMDCSIFLIFTAFPSSCLESSLLCATHWYELLWTRVMRVGLSEFSSTDVRVRVNIYNKVKNRPESYQRLRTLTKWVV